MNTKKELDEDWADTMATLEQLRSVIVKQRIKWRVMIAKQDRPLNTDFITTLEKKFFDYIVKLHKESEVLEHMINRIENGMNKRLTARGWLSTELERLVG